MTERGMPTTSRGRRPLRVPPRMPAPGAPPPVVTDAMAAGRRMRLGGDGVRLVLAVVVMLAGLALAVAAGRGDMALHRGVETGVGATTPRQTIGRDLAANVDLTQFEPAVLPEVASSLQQNGIAYVRQSFAWAEIEPAPGQFRWERSDAIVEALAAHQLVPLAVLHRAPAWARAPEQAAAVDGPPLDVRTFERFAAAFTARYGARVPYVQLWDLPNRSDHWGDQAPDAAPYVVLLGAGVAGARSGDPTTTVVLAELGAAGEGAAIEDIAFLRQIYANGGASLFDVVAARADGGQRGPHDRRMDAAEPSLSRLVLFREAMVAADDAATPVWATHYGWSADPAAGVDPSQQAAFLLAGIARARAEWPWLGPLFAWGLRPGPAVGGDVPAERALLGPNNAPTPQMVALAAAAAAGIDEAAATGFLPVDSRQIVYTAGDWRPQHLGPDAYRTTTEIGAELGVAFVGTGVTARLRVGPELGTVVATLDGEPIALPLEAFQAQDADVVIAEGLSPGMHRLTLRLGSEGELTLGGFFVERAIPLQWPMIVMLGSGVVLLLVGARSAIALVAERTGRLQRRRGVELWPELPQLPGWQPPRRA